MMSLLSDPDFMRKANGWLTIFWFVLAFPICIFLSGSLPFIVFISVYAVVTGHWAAWQSARAEVEAADDSEVIRKIEEHEERAEKRGQ